jgi:hypothetical protein
VFNVQPNFIGNESACFESFFVIITSTEFSTQLIFNAEPGGLVRISADSFFSFCMNEGEGWRSLFGSDG